MPHKNRTPVRIAIDDPHFAAWRKTRHDAELLAEFFQQPEPDEPDEPEPRRRMPAPPSLVAAYAPFIVAVCLVVLCIFLLSMLY